jgi:poly(3-hydroxybutyrate) depolymerase
MGIARSAEMLPMYAFLTATVLLIIPAQEPTPRTWDVSGVKRQALVYAPTKKTEGKVPLVFDFHGHGGTARHAARTHQRGANGDMLGFKGGKREKRVGIR